MSQNEINKAELAIRRACVENHFHQLGLSDEEVMAYNPLPSENFSEETDKPIVFYFEREENKK